MTNAILWLILSAMAWMKVEGVCETFSSICSVTVGEHFPVTAGLTYASVPADEEFYVTFTVSQAIFVLIDRLIHLLLFFL